MVTFVASLAAASSVATFRTAAANNSIWSGQCSQREGKIKRQLDRCYVAPQNATGLFTVCH